MNSTSASLRVGIPAMNATSVVSHRFRVNDLPMIQQFTYHASLCATAMRCSSNARASTACASILGGGKAHSELEHGQGEPFCRVLRDDIGRPIDADGMGFEVLVPRITMTDAEEGVHRHHSAVSAATDDGNDRHRRCEGEDGRD